MPDYTPAPASNRRHFPRKRGGYEPCKLDMPIAARWVSPCCNAACVTTCDRDWIPEGEQVTWFSRCTKCGDACEPVKR